MLVARTQRSGRCILQLDRQPGTAGDVAQGFQEQRCTALALSEVRHQQRRERDEPRTGLSLWDTSGQRRGGRDAATRTPQPVLLVFDDDRPDLRQFKHLMPERLWVVPLERLSTAPTLRWLQRDGLGHLFWRDERSLMFLVTFLSAPFTTGGLPFRRRLFGMRMLAGGRHRRVLWIHPNPAFQLGDFRFERFNPRQQKLNERPHRRRHLGFEFRRNRDLRRFLAHVENLRQSRRLREDQVDVIGV